jgi:hypothetical protein
MNTQVVRALASAGLCINLAGCGISALSTRASNPVIDHIVTEGGYLTGKPLYGVISTTAGRRSTFIKYNVNGGSDVCSEAPPDAIDAYSNALSTAVQGKAASGPSAEASFANSFGVSSGLGLYRSQGLQYLRDQSFSLCLMLINGHIDTQQWIDLHEDAVNRTETLIRLEMPAIEAAASRPPLIVTAPNVSIAGANVSASPSPNEESKQGTQQGTVTPKQGTKNGPPSGGSGSTP